VLLTNLGQPAAGLYNNVPGGMLVEVSTMNILSPPFHLPNRRVHRWRQYRPRLRLM
jgi:hypothetical protein